MARERIESTAQEEPRNSTASREEISARAIDLENEGDVQFLRTEKRIPVRRGSLAKKTASRLKIAVLLGAALFLFACLAVAAYGYGMRAARFRIDSSDSIEVSGVHNASRAQVMDIVRQDVGKNVFFVPLEERKAQLEQISWVERASVMRLLPSRIAVSITERTPVAFVLIGSKTSLIDANGVIMGPAASRQATYSFPVVRGITENEALSSRATVMKIYNTLMLQLDSGSEHYTAQVSEVDLSDPDDVKVTVNDAGGTVLLHLGGSDFLERYKLFASHIGELRQQFKSVPSVDLRFEGQIIVNPDGEHAVPVAPAPQVVKPAVSPQPAHAQTRHKWRKKGQ